MRLVLWHLFLLLCSHCFILLLHLFLRHIFCLLILFVLLVLLVLLLLSNTWRRLKWFADFHRTYLKKPLQSTRSGIHSASYIQSIHTNKKLYKLWWTQKPSQSGLTQLHHQHPLAKEQEHYICTRTKGKNEKHRKAAFRHSSLVNPCPRWEHALGQRPVINRFTSGCWKDTAWGIYQQIPSISWHGNDEYIQIWLIIMFSRKLPSWGITDNPYIYISSDIQEAAWRQEFILEDW